MEQLVQFAADRWSEFNEWQAGPLTNGTLLFVAFFGVFYLLLALHQLRRALKGIHYLLYKQVNGEYPSFDLLA